MVYKIIRKLLTVWDALSNTSARYLLRSAGVIIGNNVKCYGMPSLTLYKGSTVIVGDNVTLRSRCRGNAIGINHAIVFTTLSAEARIEIGENVGVSGGAICAKSLVSIGKNTLLGANMVIADNDMHPVDPIKREKGERYDFPVKEVRIGRNVWIGADVFICKGVTVGDNSVIGAKSVVVKSIPANCIAAGNPARVIKEIPQL